MLILPLNYKNNKRLEYVFEAVSNIRLQGCRR